ncbi:PIN domain-containing protein [Dolichospermum sp. LEGE 00240]|uniref:type II toxin-antitoxin system VapC family toxin n=1 Tax=Dolichospermum sp. LEGE 00240 TaxID=1828603 RepID=UPI00188125D4|nr:PIN domain-containing protein [Dolichospermum sp. LEGE 00240]MBE9250813.1 PIN domain-containing protein [Dolichospermum sp. LEGE 00240]
MHYQVIVDTGILLTLIDRNDVHHTWVTEQLKEIAPPLLTCEAVISESWFLLQRVKRGREILPQLLAQKQIIIQFDLDAELVTVMTLLSRYQSVPVSLADAELVRMSELYPSSLVFTLDSDFLVYRKNRDRPIPLLMPLLDT